MYTSSPPAEVSLSRTSSTEAAGRGMAGSVEAIGRSSSHVTSGHSERGLRPRNRIAGGGRKEHALRHATTAGRGEAPSGSQGDELSYFLAMVRRVAERELRRLRALEVEVQVVLPREPDAAMQLDAGARDLAIG